MAIVTRAEVLVALGMSASLTDANAALIDMLLPLSDAAIKSYMQNDLQYSQHVEYYPAGSPVAERDDVMEPILRGNVVTFANIPPGVDTLQLKHTPILVGSIEVREDVGAWAGQDPNPFDDTTILTLGTDYYLDVDNASTNMSRTGLLYRYGKWPTEARSVKVTYYGGLNASQLNNAWGDIKLAAIMTHVHHFQIFKSRQSKTGAGPITSESIGKYSYSRDAFMTRLAILGDLDVPAGAKALLFKHRNLGRLFA